MKLGKGFANEKETIGGLCMPIAETFTSMLAVDPGLTVKTSGKAARTDPDLPMTLPLRGYVS